MPTRLRLPATLAAAAIVAEAAVVALRPRERPAPRTVDARAYFTEAELAKARRFRRGQRWIGAARGAVELAALSALVARPPRALAAARRPVVAGAGAAAGMAVGGTVLALPLRAVARERARRVGLVTQNWSGWAGDVAKGVAVEAPLAAGGGALLVAGVRRFGRRWWLPGAIATTVFGTATATLAPLLLDPIFNRFTPLAPGPLRDDVLGLAERAGVRVGEVYEVDASRRTTAANAYVTGLGPTKRVVLFDTLLRDFTPGDVRFVVAHELGHVRHRDVPRGLAQMAAVAPAGMLAVARLAERLGADGAAALPGVALAGALVAPVLAAISSQLSRAIEIRTDAFAVGLTGEADAVAGFHQRIACSNVIDPQPPAFERLLASHPSTMERIGLALAAAGERR